MGRWLPLLHDTGLSTSHTMFYYYRRHTMISSFAISRNPCSIWKVMVHNTGGILASLVNLIVELCLPVPFSMPRLQNLFTLLWTVAPPQ